METYSKCALWLISIHAPREGGDGGLVGVVRQSGHFNPRPPRGGRLSSTFSCFITFSISIHAPREGGRLIRKVKGAGIRLISIHAPREGGDSRPASPHSPRWHFNPRPPRGGRRQRDDRHGRHYAISIHAPREGGDSAQDRHGATIRISIHAPREGGRLRRMASLTSVQRFQSTPPARGATPRPCCSPWAATHFNPRPPRGGRPITVCSCPTRRLFQSTPPARGATVINHRIADLENISIHAPREGGDRLSGLGAARGGDFNPRPPRGGRPKRPKSGSRR